MIVPIEAVHIIALKITGINRIKPSLKLSANIAPKSVAIPLPPQTLKILNSCAQALLNTLQVLGSLLLKSITTKSLLIHQRKVKTPGAFPIFFTTLEADVFPSHF